MMYNDKNESYEEAMQEKHICKCPECGYEGPERDFIKPEFFQGNKDYTKNGKKKGLMISIGQFGGTSEEDNA